MNPTPSDNNQKYAFSLTKTQMRVGANIIFWTLFIAFDSLSTSATLAGYFGYCLTRTLIHCLVFTILIYPNIYYLYPRYIGKRQYFRYATGILILFGITLLLRFQIDYLMSSPENVKQYFSFIYNEELSLKGLQAFQSGGYIDKNGNFSVSYYLGMTIGTIGVFVITTTMNLIEGWIDKQRLEIKILKETAQNQQTQLVLKNKEVELRDAKIQFLKAQTNPHFLINAISGVYNMALLQSNKVDTALLRLSDLMAYLLGKGTEEYISLQSEVDFINNYLDFSRLIYLDEVNISFDCMISSYQLSSIDVPPMLFQPFLENALKHGDAMDNPKGWIKSELKIQDDQIVFFMENTVKPKSNNRRIKSYGVGLKNLKERLEMYFPEKHQLSIQSMELRYKVRLVLEVTN